MTGRSGGGWTQEEHQGQREELQPNETFNKDKNKLPPASTKHASHHKLGLRLRYQSCFFRQI